ncbi:hypothetical protein MBLNU13_g00344t2 [Cladosporium sp. NU13]
MFTLVADFSLDAPVTVNGDLVNNNVGSAYDSTQYSFSIHYHTNFTFMAGALVSTFVCALFVLPTYCGFWQLGRKLALSPLEIAAAFRSPLVDSGKDIDGILQEAGKKQPAKVRTYAALVAAKVTELFTYPLWAVKEPAATEYTVAVADPRLSPKSDPSIAKNTCEIPSNLPITVNEASESSNASASFSLLTRDGSVSRTLKLRYWPGAREDSLEDPLFTNAVP